MEESVHQDTKAAGRSQQKCPRKASYSLYLRSRAVTVDHILTQ